MNHVRLAILAAIATATMVVFLILLIDFLEGVLGAGLGEGVPDFLGFGVLLMLVGPPIYGVLN